MIVKVHFIRHAQAVERSTGLITGGGKLVNKAGAALERLLDEKHTTREEGAK